ncbi:MAG TPA: hypothetical protein VM369_03865 [Candidatus Binatia bacterium]|nr:hypothetical protein [Candidatus Binatia bacterium]
MKYLQLLNAALAALGAALGAVLAVVCVLYWVYLDLDPKLPAQLPQLVMAAALCAALGVAGLGAFLAQRRGWSARWLLQFAPLGAIAGLVLFFLRLRS